MANQMVDVVHILKNSLLGFHLDIAKGVSPVNSEKDFRGKGNQSVRNRVVGNLLDMFIIV